MATTSTEKFIDPHSYHGSLSYVHYSIYLYVGYRAWASCYSSLADATFDCTPTFNVIAQLTHGLNMIQHQKVKHLTALY